MKYLNLYTEYLSQKIEKVLAARKSQVEMILKIYKQWFSWQHVESG